MVPFYTNVFAEAEFGVVTELYAWAVTINIVLIYGMETGFFRFSEKDGNKDKVFSTSFYSLLITTSIFLALILLSKHSIASALGYMLNPEYIVYFAVILSIDALMAMPFVRLRSENRPIRFALLKVSNVIINISANVFFIVLCPYLIENYTWAAFLTHIYNPAIGVGYVFISNLIASAATFVMLTPQLRQLKASFDLRLLRTMLLYSLPLLLAGLGGAINETLDRVLLKHLLPNKETAMAQLGIYGANVRLAVLMALFTQMFRFAAEPFFFSYAKEKDSKQVFANITKYFSIFGMFIFLFIMLNIQYFQYFEGEKYRVGLSVVPILLISNLFLGIYFNLSIWYKLSDRTIWGTYLTLIGATFTVLINLLFVSNYGYMASAWGHLFAYMAMMVLCYLIGQRTYHIPYDLKSIGIYALVTTTLFIVSKIFSSENMLLLTVFNNLMLFFFIWFIIFKEKIKISSLWRLKS